MIMNYFHHQKKYVHFKIFSFALCGIITSIIRKNAYFLHVNFLLPKRFIDFFVVYRDHLVTAKTAEFPPGLDCALRSWAALSSFLDTQSTSAPSSPWAPSRVLEEPALGHDQPGSSPSPALRGSPKRQGGQCLPAHWTPPWAR